MTHNAPNTRGVLFGNDYYRPHPQIIQHGLQGQLSTLPVYQQNSGDWHGHGRLNVSNNRHDGHRPIHLPREHQGYGQEVNQPYPVHNPPDASSGWLQQTPHRYEVHKPTAPSGEWHPTSQAPMQTHQRSEEVVNLNKSDHVDNDIMPSDWKNPAPFTNQVSIFIHPITS